MLPCYRVAGTCQDRRSELRPHSQLEDMICDFHHSTSRFLPDRPIKRSALDARDVVPVDRSFDHRALDGLDPILTTIGESDGLLADEKIQIVECSEFPASHVRGKCERGSADKKFNLFPRLRK